MGRSRSGCRYLDDKKSNPRTAYESTLVGGLTRTQTFKAPGPAAGMPGRPKKWRRGVMANLSWEAKQKDGVLVWPGKYKSVHQVRPREAAEECPERGGRRDEREETKRTKRVR